MRPNDENWLDDSARNFSSERSEGENPSERKSYNPNFNDENKLNSGDGVRRPRKRVGESRYNVESNYYNNGSSSYRRDDYEGGYNNRGGYNGGGNRGGYNGGGNRGGYNGGNRGGYNGGNRGGYNGGNRGGYNGGGYNNNSGENSFGGSGDNSFDRNENNYNYSNEGGYNGGGYNGGNRGGYNGGNRGGYNGGGNRGGYNGGGNRGGYNGGGNRGGYNGGGNRGGYNNRGGMGGRKPQGGGQQRQKYNPQRQIEYKSIVVDPNEPIRLNKFLANAGVCSRREADELIQAGVVTVNGAVISELGTKILRGDKVMIHDQLVAPDKKVYILLNKPKDCVTTSDDPYAKMTVMDLVKNACQERIYPVGRLDRNTTGVLLLTNDGDLAAKLTHPKYNKKKIYQVSLDKPLQKDDFDKLINGITLDDGEIKVDELNFIDESDLKKVGVEIHSGRNRIVRRIFEHVGYRVCRLDRVYFAGLTKKNLRRGQWRFLTEKEVNMLRMGSFE